MDYESSPPRYLTFEDLSVWLGMSVQALRRRVSRGQIPAVRIGTSIRFDRDAVSAWIAESSKPPHETKALPPKTVTYWLSPSRATAHRHAPTNVIDSSLGVDRLNCGLRVGPGWLLADARMVRDTAKCWRCWPA